MLPSGLRVVAATASRRKPESHQLFLVLATISALGPAWFRFRHFMRFMPEPLVSFLLMAISVLLVAMAREWLVCQRVHPVYCWAGGAMFVVHVIELSAADSQLWLPIGRWLLGVPVT